MTRGEVRAACKAGRIVAIVVDLIAGTEVRARDIDIIVRANKIVAVERPVVVQASSRIGLPVRRGDGGIRVLDCRKCGSHCDRNRRLLLDPLRVSEEEQLVLDNRAANAAAELISLERGLDAARRIGEESAIVLEVIESLPMKPLVPELVETSTWPVEVTSPETSCVERFS